MVTCGHQFKTGDACDWLISSSATCPIDGNTGASRILQKLIKKHCQSKGTDKKIRKKGKGKCEVYGNEEAADDEEEEADITADDQHFGLYSQPDNNHYTISRLLQDRYAVATETGASHQQSFLQSKAIQLAVSKDRESKLKHTREARIKYNKSRITAFYNFEDFDENEHLEGCPVKWLFRRQHSEAAASGKWTAWRCERTTSETTTKRDRTGGNGRNTTPAEICIRKIPLRRRKNSLSSNQSDEETDKEIDLLPPFQPTRRLRPRSLPVEINWRALNHSQHISNLPDSGYLPPRPLVKLKPLLSILLSPRRDITCCALTLSTREPDSQPYPSASLSIKSLDLTYEPQQHKSFRVGPMQTSMRWGNKMSKNRKKPQQIHNKVTIKLRQLQNMSDQQQDSYNDDDSIHITNKPTAVKKPIRYSQSLSSLCYDLDNKTRLESRKLKYFERIISELETEDKQMKIARFFNSSSRESSKYTDTTCKQRSNDNQNFYTSASNHGSEGEFHIVCSKVQFYERPGKPMK